jgi:hypothetical protein
MLIPIRILLIVHAFLCSVYRGRYTDWPLLLAVDRAQLNVNHSRRKKRVHHAGNVFSRAVFDMNAFPAPICGNVRLQRWILRIAAIFQFTALPGIILPRQAIEKFSWLMGQGQPPLVPLMVYLTGGGAFVYLVLGALLWLFSTDVVRYRPLVIASAWICLIGGPAFLWIDSQSRLPAWWVAMDCASCLIIGAALLWACYSGKRRA